MQLCLVAILQTHKKCWHRSILTLDRFIVALSICMMQRKGPQMMQPKGPQKSKLNFGRKIMQEPRCALVMISILLWYHCQAIALNLTDMITRLNLFFYHNTPYFFGRGRRLISQPTTRIYSYQNCTPGHVNLRIPLFLLGTKPVPAMVNFYIFTTRPQLSWHGTILVTNLLSDASHGK